MADAPDGVTLPQGSRPDPDHPGWYSWGASPPGAFTGSIGRVLFRPDGPGRGRCRMFPDASMLNPGGFLHGGAAMTFIDISLFAGGMCAGMTQSRYVTLDCHVHFIDRAMPGEPLDASVNLVGQSGGHAFLAGSCIQGVRTTSSWTGILKRIRESE